MGLETGTTIAALNAAWPLGTDPRSQGDDHLRLIKAVVKNDAPSKAATAVQTFAGPLRSGDIYIGANPTGGANASTISGATGVAPLIRSGTETGNMIVFQSAAGVSLGAITPAGTAAPSPNTIITAEKGDFRYLQLGVAGVATAPLRVGDIYIAGNPVGGANASTISGATGVAPSIRSGTETGNMFVFQSAAAVSLASITVAGTSAPSPTTIMTREKGDLRYAPKVLLLAALQALADSAPVAELRDALIAALSAPIDMSEA